jgi:hypothetical protein
MVKIGLYYYTAAATTTAMAGTLHLVLVPNMICFNINSTISFIVAGLAQLFWAMPIIKRWGIWYYIGMVSPLVTNGVVFSGHITATGKPYATSHFGGPNSPASTH